MSCSEFQIALSAELDGALVPDEVWALEEHLVGCLACRAEREALAQVAAQVRGLERVRAPAHFVAQVMAGALASGAEDSELPARRAGVDRGADDATSEAGASSARPASARLQRSPASMPTCAALAEDLSADLDEALDLGARARLHAHLAECAGCRDERRRLSAVQSAVRRLPRIAAPPPFRSRVLAALDELDEEESRRREEARRSRLAWWGRATWVARAAGLLLVVGGGLALTSPNRRMLAWVPATPQASAPRTERAPTPGDAPPEAPRRAGAASFADGPPGAIQGRIERGESFDAVWELTCPSGVEEASGVVRGLLSRFAQSSQAVAQEVSSPESGPSEDADAGLEFVAEVPANRVDDLHEGLERASAVEVGPESWASLRRIHAEQDRVVRKNGFVLVGDAVEQRGRLSLRTAEAVHLLDAADVERVEDADSTRRLRIVLRRR